ncbi:MAG TPA: inositol 2-dehydrogenase [Solirubrobacteraceae bacterium]|nr:inositol 2-dehydrogenase [Solirubrobacteraceae bacterium]
MRDPLRVAVIGAGRIGTLHAELLAHGIAGAALAAIHDLRPAAAKAAAARLGVPAASSVDALLADPGVDAVAICSSTDTHADLIVRAAEAGKAVFCEKPVSLDLETMDRALDAVAAAGVAFQIGFNRRFDAAHASVRLAVQSGEIGTPHLVRITSRDPAPPPREYLAGSGGMFLDMSIHDFDMARYVTGSEVVEVFARGAARVDPAIAEFGDIDTALITLVHEDGCLTVIDNSRCAVYGYDQRVEAFGSGGVATSDNPLVHTGLVRKRSGTRTAELPTFFLDRYLASYRAEWEGFVCALRAGQAPPVGPEDARAPLVIGLAAGRSLHEERAVPVAEIEAAPA